MAAVRVSARMEDGDERRNRERRYDEEEDDGEGG